MGDTNEVVLSDIIELIGGGTPKTSIPEYWGGEIPWLSVVDFNTGKKYVLDTEKKITTQGLNNSSTTILSKGDIIISARGTVGVIAVLGKQMAFNQSCYGVRAIEGLSTNDFIYYLLKDTVSNFLLMAHGGVFDTITRDTFKKIDVTIPPLPEQKAIASVLSSLDDKIDLLHRQNKTLEAMAETLFRQWFVEEAREDWEEKKLGELVTITRGASPRPIVKYVKNGTVPWIKIADATGSHSFYINSTKEFIIKEGVSKSVQVFPGDLILSNSATCGLPFFVELEGCIHDGWLLFRDFSVLSKFFVFFFLKQINRELNNVADGSVQNNLNTGILKEYELKKPDGDTLNKFDEVVKPIINKMRYNNSQIQTLENLRDTLLPKLMSGEIRIKT